jgi:hypothetical protein
LKFPRSNRPWMLSGRRLWRMRRKGDNTYEQKTHRRRHKFGSLLRSSAWSSHA